MIRRSSDRSNRETNIENDESFRHMDPLTADLACSVTNTKFKLDVNEKGEVDVCRAVKEIREEERREGRVEGRAEGRAEGRNEGLNELADLINMLFHSGRMNDIERVAGDPVYREAMLKQFMIQPV